MSLCLLLGAAADAGAAIERVTVALDGTQPNAFSEPAESQAVGGDGRYVAFSSFATNLVEGDTSSCQDIFVRDLTTDTTERASVSSTEVEADGCSEQPALSANGRFVAFMSPATNLVPDDTNSGVTAGRDIFVRDLEAGMTERVSVDSEEAEGIGDFTFAPSISADGRYVAFDTDMRLDPDDPNANNDVYVRDRLLGTTEWISAPGHTSRDSTNASISPDGRYVSFSTSAALIAADTNEQEDIYVRDRITGDLVRASVGAGGEQGDSSTWEDSVVTADGIVAFTSDATNMVPGDTNENTDVFVHDLEGATQRVSVGGGDRQVDGGGFGVPTMSDDARFVAFNCGDNLIPGRSVSGCVRDRQEQRTRTLREAPDAVFRLSPDGQQLAFASSSSELPENPPDDAANIYLADFPPSNDDVPPELELPDPIVVEATSGGGAVVEFEATATDETDTAPGVHCDPASGEEFPLGVTQVQCVAADEGGNEDVESFTVTVQDTTPPRLEGPEEIEIEPTEQSGEALVDWARLLSAEDSVDETLPILCDDFESPDLFPVGTSQVECSATDDSGNSAQKQIAIVVGAGPPPALSISSMRVIERLGIAELQLSLPEVAGSDIELSWQTADGSATAVRDYTASEGIATIPAGQRFAFISVDLNRDRREEDTETFEVRVTGSGGLPDVTGTVTIDDDDDPPPPSERGTTNGPILFAGESDQQSGILKLDPDPGAEPELLVPSPMNSLDNVSDPSVSPDGTSVLYAFSEFDGIESTRHGLAVVDIEGGEPQEIDVRGRPTDPAWRPDGDAFAYVNESSNSIVLVTVGGSEEDLATLEGSVVHDITWSPDGTKIAFGYVGEQSGTFDIGVLDTLDGVVEPLTSTTDCGENSPSWSPAGNQIAVELSCGAGDPKLGIVPAAGGEATELPIEPGGSASYRQPSWSPDGQRIAFIRTLFDDTELSSVAADGSDLTPHARLTSWQDVEWGPSAVSGPPETFILSGPEGSTGDNTPTFEFSSNELGSTFECSVDGEVIPDCESPFTPAAGLPDGTYTFEVTATDAEGNSDETPATRTFTVDTTPPSQPVIDAGPPDTTTATTATFVFSGDPGVSFRCSLDGAAFAPCTSPFTTPALSAGQHRFEVQSVDAAQNLGPVMARTWTIAQQQQQPPTPPPLLDDMGLPALTDSDVGVTANVTVVNGTVLLGIPPGASTARRSGQSSQRGVTFVPLTEARQIPIGSFLDTRRGTVRLRSATGSQNATQTGDFGRGLFQVLQSRAASARGLTELALKGGSFSRARCGARNSSAGTGAAQVRRRVVRRLRSNATGRFRTRGRHSAATVRGTVWETTDRCDGTLTKVTRGTVSVRDFRRRKTIVVRAGRRTKGPGGGRGSYLARAR